MRPILGASLASMVAALACSLACSSDGGTVQLAPTLVFPKGLLDGVTQVTVSAYDTGAGVDCDTTTGNPTGATNVTPKATKDLASTGCAPPAKFCGDLQIDRSSVDYVFAAKALTGSNPVAAGCTRIKVDQATLQVQIKMLRYLPPFFCGTQPSAVPTQCKDPGSTADPICDASCISKEMYLSAGNSNDTFDGKPKTHPRLIWPTASGDPGRMLGFWGEQRAAGNEVSMRVLGDDLTPTTTQGTVVEQSSFRLPATPNGGIPTPNYPFSQNNPTAASLGGNYYVAFEDNSTSAVAIKMRSLDAILNPLQGAAVVVSDATGSAQALPSMAVNGNNLFVAWENQGSVVGKTVSSSMTLGTQKTLGSGSAVSVASTPTGWVAAFQSGTDVQMVTIDGTGTPGAPVKVNDGSHSGPQTHPGVATLINGTVAVVWLDTGAANGGNVFVQRYDATGKAVANDQATPINDTALTSAQATPSVAAGTNFYIATWVDSGSGHVRGRYLDGAGGFLYNDVTGQSGDFQASLLDGDTRANPSAAVGGGGANGPYVIIAWEDSGGASGQGIYGRRFTLPQ